MTVAEDILESQPASSRRKSRQTNFSAFPAFKELAKSGIVALVLISVLGGYLIGHSPERDFSPFHLMLTLVGIMALASGSSALNQFQEQAIDAQMPRTSGRPLPSGRITRKQALLFIVLCLAAGLSILAAISLPVLGLGLMAVIFYNGLYTLWWKKHWAYAAVPGAIPGALPILMGYAAASGEVLTPAGLYLFAILFYWQMPHFWVLALRYSSDYAQGGIPTLPVVHGKQVTVRQIAAWTVFYVVLALGAPLFLHVGRLYLALAVPMCLKIFWELAGFARQPEGRKWLHFFLWVNFSLIVFIAAATLDLWGVVLVLPHLVR